MDAECPTLIQQEKLQVRPLHHSHVLVGGGDLKLTCSSPGCCFCCLLTMGWSQTDSPTELLLLCRKALRRKPKRNIKDDTLLNGPSSIPFCRSKTTHRLSYDLSPAHKWVQTETLGNTYGEKWSYTESSKTNSWKHKFMTTDQRRKPQIEKGFHFHFENCAVPLHTLNSFSQT